jgi:23S rRNA (uracil1939-C5)-methyltransferase
MTQTESSAAQDIAPAPRAAPQPLRIESLDHEGRGIARRDGKVIFVEGALPGELVDCLTRHRKPSFEIASVTRVIEESSSRVSPGCRHFGLCGGCTLQHMDLPTQVAAKQRVLEDAFTHIGKVEPDMIMPAIHGPAWGYRHRARLTVRDVRKKGGVLVGFHEKRSSFVADMDSCEVLPRRISDLLVPMRRLVEGLSIRQRLPQIEIAIGHEVDVLVFRNLEPLNGDDETLLRDFADRHAVRIYLQPSGPQSVDVLHPPGPDPFYLLPEFDIRISFSPTDFTQVNHAMNQVLVRRALHLLDPQPGERIADMFCGIGNFTLPIARSGAEVLGIEGSKTLIERAQRNAGDNDLPNATFKVMDLFKIDIDTLGALGPFHRMLIDPPRDGAAELVKSLGADLPRRIVYVSCNASTLARDAGMLVHTQGFRLKAAGIANMFPHTAHVESIALFERD